MVTVDDLKDYLNIDFNDDDNKLGRKLDSAIQVVERYTNQSLSDKVVTHHVYGSFDFYGAPIEDVETTLRIEYNSLGFRAYGNGTVKVTLGIADKASLDEAILRIAGSLYEGIVISEVSLPIDVQLLLNPFILDSFLS